MQTEHWTDKLEQEHQAKVSAQRAQEQGPPDAGAMLGNGALGQAVGNAAVGNGALDPGFSGGLGQALTLDLRGRVLREIAQARRAAGRYDAASELLRLLDRNAETARIIELARSLGLV